MWTTLSPEDVVPVDHPLRSIRKTVNEVFAELSPEFSKLYSKRGRPSIAPEKLLRAQLILVFYSIPSEPLLIEQLQYNLLFRWFVGLGMDDTICNVSTFSKNRGRFLSGEISRKFFEGVVKIAVDGGFASSEHFTVDGSLLQAWASHKSFKPKPEGDEPPAPPTGRNPDVDFSGTKRSNDTHSSTTDLDARRYKKSRNTTSILGYLAHALMENRNGLIVGSCTTRATGMAEREAALELLKGRGCKKTITLGADKGYDSAALGAELRAHNVTPHIARNTSRRSAIDGRTTRHEGYEQSQRKRKRVEETFGWSKTRGNLRQVHFRGLALVSDLVTWTFAAFNSVRLRNLLASA